MSDFNLEFKWCTYEHRADVVVEDAEDGDFYLTSLEYKKYLPIGFDGISKHKWVDVSYLLDTDAAGSIHEAAEVNAMEQYDEYCKEDYTTPEDYE